MKVSTKGRYALRFMLDLALHNTGGFITLKEISTRQELSTKYLEQIVNLLNKANCLQSSRGVGGGYRLARHPKDYSIGEILRISEGSLAPVACIAEEILDYDCPNILKGCATRKLWQGLYDVVNEYLDSYTLQQLIDSHLEIEQDKMQEDK